jgi:putative ABC transport system permease protein
LTLWDLVRLGVDSMRAAGVRTVLTTLGVAVATAALVAMVAGGKGLQDNFRNRLLDSGILLNIAIFPGNGVSDAESVFRAAAKLDDAALATIAGFDGVKRVTRDIRLPFEIHVGTRSAEAVSVGMVQEAITELPTADLAAGRWFQTEDAEAVVVSQAIARTLGFKDASRAVGQVVTLRLGGRFFARAVARSSPFGLFGGDLRIDRRLKIVGVMPRERMGFGSLGAAIILPYGQALRTQDELMRRIPLASRIGTSYSATVRMESVRDVEGVEAKLHKLGYTTVSASAFLKRAQPVILLVDGLLAVVGSIGLAIACLGIANTMITEVFERTREIGILKAIGAENKDILRLFLGQSMLYGLVGGLVGILLALGIAGGVQLAADWYFRQNGADEQRIFAFPAWLLLGTLALSMSASAAAAIYPAMRAARLDPAKALRHD